MSFNKCINNSYCVGGKHYSPTTNIHGEITNTGIRIGRPVHTLRGNCVTCNRKKSLIVSERTIDGEKDWETFPNIWAKWTRTLERKYSITQAVH